MKGKTVLVTGAARGIGRHIAHTFAHAGADVAIADIEPVTKVVTELHNMGANAIGVQTDVMSEQAVRAMTETVANAFGSIDVLVNNAAVVTHSHWGTPPWPRIREMETSFWEQVIGTNLGGTFLCTKYVLPFMEEKRSGHIINVAGGGASPRPGNCAYIVSKRAVETLTEFVAFEEREWNICVVCMSPGATIATDEAPEHVRQRMPGPSIVGDRFVRAAQAGMDLSGHHITVESGMVTMRNPNVHDMW